jgi:hypothetical protein
MRKTMTTKMMILGLLALIVAGCSEKNQINDPHYGSGRIATQVRNVSECNSVNIRYAGNVYLTQDNTQTVRVEADDNIIDDVITQGENGVLSVGLQSGSYKDVTVRIYMSLKTIEGISINGVGNITVQNKITGDQLSCTINGAGDIYLNGSYSKLNCLINGAGNINAFDLIAKSCTAGVSGTGNCSINVTESLDASIQGVGNITYDGNPGMVKSSISGIGKISHR